MEKRKGLAGTAPGRRGQPLLIGGARHGKRLTVLPQIDFLHDRERRKDGGVGEVGAGDPRCLISCAVKVGVIEGEPSKCQCAFLLLGDGLGGTAQLCGTQSHIVGAQSGTKQCGLHRQRGTSERCTHTPPRIRVSKIYPHPSLLLS